MLPNKIEGFFVHNISKMNVSVGDLRLYIPAKKVVNLLDSRHYRYSFEQLMKSYTSGSLSKKQDKLIVQFEAPKKIEYKNLTDPRKIEISPVPMDSKYIFNLRIQEVKFEELDFSGPSDEQFAAEFSAIYEEDSEKAKTEK